MKGAAKEREISLRYQNETALLVSGLLLRRIGAGQIDYCFIKEKRIHLLECKSSLTGVCHYQGKQAQRMRRSAQLLAQVCELETRILLV